MRLQTFLKSTVSRDVLDAVLRQQVIVDYLRKQEFLAEQKRLKKQPCLK